MRRKRTLVAVTVAVLVAVGTPAATAADPVHLGSIGPDDTLFWQDGYVGDHPLHSPPLLPAFEQVDRCDLHGACSSFTLDVTGTGEALRLGYDTPMRDDGFLFTVTDPNGTVTQTRNSNNYSMEVVIPNPTPGTWRLDLDPYSAEDAPFRLRAKLESVHYRPTADEDGYLLPNLRLLRMWEFGFVAPANPGNGLFPPDDVNPPLEVAGVAPISCALDETVDDGTQRCLRYSFGLGNAGDGVFDIRWTGDRVGLESHTMYQCMQRADGTTEARDAGTGSFHTTHGHWHYDDVVHHELFRVTEPGVLESTGNGKKIGYSPADQAIADWDKFVQAPPGTSGQAGNCVEGSNSRLGMSAGWGDAYRYQRPGNYVDFADAGDGEFVVQTVADPLDRILESDETDNTMYAHIVVSGDDVEVLETGIGDSPWDPAKRVIEDWWA